MYLKRWTSMTVFRDYPELSDWVEWKHHEEGKTHCEECLKLDGCWFQKNHTPVYPHHPHCHCTLEPVSYITVLLNAESSSDYRKFDPFLFNTNGNYTHKKEKLFAQWGYSVEDARWLQREMERQAHEKYIKGDYVLGKLDHDGQRVSIRIELPRKDVTGKVSFISGWMIQPGGKIRLVTPYGGK